MLQAGVCSKLLIPSAVVTLRVPRSLWRHGQLSAEVKHLTLDAPQATRRGNRK